ncbi:MAG TPA: hypothetical protein EYG92_07680 [Lutibacter sp.]|nr:hypothetical protein [Lutibacter sp.]
MKTTLEISKYPLDKDYKKPIKDFISRINKNPDFTVLTSATNTQISGDYDQVMQLIQNEVKISFEKYGKVVFVMKIFNGDLLNK